MRQAASIALAVCVLVAACSTPVVTPSSSLPPSASASPSAAAAVELSPTASSRPPPSAAPTEPAVDSVPIPADTYAIVMADDLRVRSQPGVSDDSKKLDPLLQPGDLVIVLDGPVQASGYDWYLVRAIQPDSDEPHNPFGWIAAASEDGVPWIGPASMDCPPLPGTVEELGKIANEAPMYFEVTCFGGKEITFRARIGVIEGECGTGFGSSWGVDPLWLQPCTGNMFTLVPVDGSDTDVWFQPRWAPDVDTSLADNPRIPRADWPIVEVTGQFDHPAAATCRNQPAYDNPDEPEPDPALTILNCRTRFVVTSLRKDSG